MGAFTSCEKCVGAAAEEKLRRESTSLPASHQGRAQDVEAIAAPVPRGIGPGFRSLDLSLELEIAGFPWFSGCFRPKYVPLRLLMSMDDLLQRLEEVHEAAH